MKRQGWAKANGLGDFPAEPVYRRSGFVRSGRTLLGGVVCSLSVSNASVGHRARWGIGKIQGFRAEQSAAADRAGMTAFRAITSTSPARLLSFVVKCLSTGWENNSVDRLATFVA